MKIGVVGARDRTEDDVWKTISRLLSEYGPDVHIISGGCPTGADDYAEKYAKNWDIDFTRYPAKWKRYGRKAGPLRNTKIAREVDILIAFPHPNCTGTQNAIKQFKELHPDRKLLIL